VKGGGGRVTSDGLDPQWFRDGKEISCVTRDGQLMAAEVALRNRALEVGRVQSRRYYHHPQPTNDVYSDGQKILVVDDSESIATAARR
jgi:hypothetical protein